MMCGENKERGKGKWKENLDMNIKEFKSNYEKILKSLKDYLLKFGISLWWWLACGGMILCFIFFCLFDWIRYFSSWAYDITALSYDVLVIIRALEFGLPALALLLIGLFLYLQKDFS